MVIVDTSVLVAIAKQEAERNAFVAALTAADGLVGAPTLVETGLVLAQAFRLPDDVLLTKLITALKLTPIDFSVEMAAEARRAHRTFGRGSGHPARLNFGDCMSYAVAKVLDLPLLFKGDDFARTDLRPAYQP